MDGTTNNKPKVMQFLVPAIKAKEDFRSQIPTVHKGKLKEKKQHIQKIYNNTHNTQHTHIYSFVNLSYQLVLYL
jgi:hypothetical protein